MKKTLFSILLIVCFVGSSVSKLSNKNIKTKKTPNPFQINQLKWVDSVSSMLSLDEKIGQFFMVAAYSNKGEDHNRSIESLIENQHIGGVIFFQGGPVRQANLTNRYQNLSKIPLLVGIDAEWGLGMRLDSTVSYPKQMTLGAIQNNYYIEKMGIEIGRQCRRLGIHINFAPVVDINNNPHNPVIGNRSFGEERENVASKGAAYARGLRKSKVMASAKHFPGHGDTDQDSHHTLPAIEHTASHLHEVELYPFQRLIDDSVASILTGHLYVPSMDNRYNLASTLSEKIVTDLLKTEMGFQGLTITDALNMKGVSRNLLTGEVDLKAFVAGNDILLYSENVAEGSKKIKQAVLNGQISRQEIDRRVRKILMAKYWAGLAQNQYVDTYGLYRDLNNYYARSVKQELFEQATTVVRNDNLLPFLNLDTTSFASVSIGADRQNEFQRSLSLYAKFKHFTLSNKPATDAEMQGILQQASKYKVVVVSVHDMNASASRNYGVTYPTISFINQLKQKTNVVVCAFGSPYSLRIFNQAKNLVCAYEDDKEAQRVVPQILFGALPSSGRLPVSSGSIFRAGEGFSYKNIGRLSYSNAESVGMSTYRLEELDNIVLNGIANRAFPGGQVLVARKGKVIYHKNYGSLAYDNIEPVTDETLYDIASVTKVASTLQAVMLLNERQAIDLNQKASFYLPELINTNKENLYISDILMHQAGLASFIPFWAKTKHGASFKSEHYAFARSDTFNLEVRQGLYVSQATPDSLWKWLKESPLNGRYDNSNGGFKYLYSDLGLIILQKVIEKVTNQPLNVFVEQNLYEPLGMGKTLYNPLQEFDKQQIAPTENDWAFRSSQLQGTVHDPTAALMGGVAGNAGIFSTANDLAILFQMNLNHGQYANRKYLLPQTVNHFSQNYTNKSHRGLGWDKPKIDEDKPIVSELAPFSSYGHSGFTGTVVWIDPTNDLIFIFLCNRVYPQISNKITTLKVRKRLHDAVYRAIVYI